MEKNNRDDSVKKDRQNTQQFQADGPDTNNDGSNEPYLADDGDTTIRKKDPKNPADWRESDAPNPSRETSGWQKSNDADDTIREPDGTYTTGERANVINSATWDPGSHTSEEEVRHVDVNDYKQNSSPQNQKADQQTKLNKNRVNKEK